MQERTFSIQDQIAFADLSGDHNPVHVDPLAARRTLFGRTVVHGVHALLWGLESWLHDRTEPFALATLRATFQTPISPEEPVQCSIEDLPGNRVEIEILNGGTPAVWMTFAWVPRSPAARGGVARRVPGPTVCRERTFEEAAAASGRLDLGLEEKAASSLFPRLTRLLEPLQMAQVLATTRLVGMECPGLHSVFSGLDLAFAAEAAGGDQLTYRARGGDPRLSLVVIDVSGPGMTGTLRAFVRPAPAVQRGMPDLSRQVRAGEFTGQRALVIGGSRGLGEVAAKLLSAGGAGARITYHRGADDARGVIDQINAWGGSASCAPFDVLEPRSARAVRPEDGWTPTHLYYFATPHITGRRQGEFSDRRFRLYCDYYVAGFLETVRAVRSWAPDLVGVFYPSSVYVAEAPPGLAEYAAAKAAGEEAARLLEKTSTGLRIHAPRLPRLATDQTASVLPSASGDPAPTLLLEIRRLRDLTGAPDPDADRA